MTGPDKKNPLPAFPSRERYVLSVGGKPFELGRVTRIMGIVNVTPDSFSDGGRFFSPQDAVAHGEALARQGADILDIGGESTRPFSEPVTAEEEIRRVVPVVRALAERTGVPISIDTNKAAVARAAVEAGAQIINDIGALRLDPEMARVAAQTGVPLVVMHMRGTPKTMQEKPVYTDLLGEIGLFLRQAMARALEAGVLASQLVVDPGIGFGKTVKHNLELIGSLRAFHFLKAPILIGPSRKAFIRKMLKSPEEKDLDPLSPIVEVGTQAAVAAAIMAGAHIVRTHHVANTRATVRIVDAIRNGSPGEGLDIE